RRRAWRRRWSWRPRPSRRAGIPRTSGTGCSRSRASSRSRSADARSPCERPIVSRQDPVALGRRLDDTLAEAERMIHGVPEALMSERGHGLDGALRDLAFRLFRLGLSFTDGMDLGRVPAEWHHETAPEDLRDGAAVARYGALVRGRLAGWLEGA